MTLTRCIEFMALSGSVVASTRERIAADRARSAALTGRGGAFVGTTPAAGAAASDGTGPWTERDAPENALDNGNAAASSEPVDTAT